MTANDSTASAAVGSLVSSLMDGDLEPDAATGTLARWRDDRELRATWHAYQLIGDVLRSDDLASTPAQDAAFLRTLRGRLAQEPVRLTRSRPAGHGLRSGDGDVAAPRRWPGWLMAPAAVAAGFVAVAGVLLVTRVVSINPADSGQLAQAVPAPAGASADLVRNAGLERYLEAHRTLANGVVASGGAEHRVQIVFEAK